MQSKKHQEVLAKQALKKKDAEENKSVEENKPVAEENKSVKEIKPVAENKIVEAPKVDLRITEETTEEEMMAMIDEKIKTAPRLEETDCLFCPHQAETFEDNMTHMTTTHSLFIPDIEFLVDLRGLIRYLGEKISVGNVCIFCNGKGRGLRTIDAVRKHMVRLHFIYIY